ncbi:hypothetical protein BLA29_010690 [Euroglyphus maynei]|uniref:Uncharacterized protein n=1 Tax=Euroglyphus maynei TaxID=6958 RepID=A0A1Y3BRS5_EURMA|nr:hypothetical protein BLA29_010690 [Euroglyphus maynei]
MPPLPIQFIGNSGNVSGGGGQTQHQPPHQYNRNVWNHPPEMAFPPPPPPLHAQQHPQSNISPWMYQNMPPHMNGLAFRGFQQSNATQQNPMDHVKHMRMVMLNF